MKLEIGYNFPFEIRKESYPNYCQDSFSVLFLSDLHLNRFTMPKITQIINSVEELDPTIILMGGDYIDSKQGLIQLKLLLSSLSVRKNIFAIAGNHDYFFGIDAIKECMQANNIIWLEKKTHEILVKNTSIRIVGNLLKCEKKESDFSILAVHNPKTIDSLEDRHDTIFAGHLHGGQIVFWKNKNGLYPGKYFYKWNILKTTRDSCQLFISKGLGDTLPIRFNCKRDMIFLKVNTT
ncbi:metallophosphoesterase [Leptospira sp. 96542]|nr:metallophosphoesterase [Leptospira sp. 96542]